jgi:hypothetical protein
MLSPETAQVAVSPSKVLAPGIDALPYLLLPLAGPDEFDLEVSLAVPVSWKTTNTALRTKKSCYHLSNSSPQRRSASQIHPFD